MEYRIPFHHDNTTFVYACRGKQDPIFTIVFVDAPETMLMFPGGCINVHIDSKRKRLC